MLSGILTREAPKVKEHTKHSQCLAPRVIRCSLDPPGKDKDLPRDWRCHPCEHWLTCSCERRLLQSRDALPMVSIPAECLPSPDSVGMGVVNKAMCSVGREALHARPLGPVLLGWMEAQDTESCWDKCVLRWDQPGANQQRTEEPRDRKLSRAAVRPCAFVQRTQACIMAPSYLHTWCQFPNPEFCP